MLLSNNSFVRRLVAILAFSMIAVSASAETITLRSGGATIGSPDPNTTVWAGSGGTLLSAAPFTANDFATACSGTSAIVCQPHPAWAPHLTCDPLAQWIGIDAFATPASAMYCQNFNVQTCCIFRATLDFCWVTDDVLGDAYAGGPNPAGVYINGVAVTPSIDGGNYATDTIASAADVTSLLHCGNNQLSIYNRDLGYAVSGVMFSATLEILDCDVSTESSSWGNIKSLYR
jgi:hypothetical protein